MDSKEKAEFLRLMSRLGVSPAQASAVEEFIEEVANRNFEEGRSLGQVTPR